MSKENKTVVLLVTAEKRQSGTQSLTEYSGIFATEDGVLNETERNVFQMYIAPIERSAKLRESSERRDYEHEKTMDRQGKARDSA